jgi:hypothetical protein
MGLIDFQVVLDNPIKVYFSGQAVSGGPRQASSPGRVLVNLSSPKKMARLKVEMVGRGEVRRGRGRLL